MGFLDRYFDSLVDPLFKTDAEGRRLFFPAGIFSRGRVLPGAAAAESLRRRIRIAYMVLFLGIGLAAGLGPVLLGNWGFAPLIVMAACAGLAFNAFFLLLARGYPRIDARLTWREASEAQAWQLGRGWIVALAIASLLLAGICALALAFDVRESHWWSLAGLFLFGAFAAAFVWQLRLLGGRPTVG